MRLWETKEMSLDPAVLAFTVGEDPVLDLRLVPFDCLASAAHADMLQAIGVLSAEDRDAAFAALAEARELALAGSFEILPEQEDGHTALEAFLTERVGEVGKKIHTGRSRNDQVIAAVRLYAREALLELADSTDMLVQRLLDRAREHVSTVMPGYTHTRQAMPSTAGHLFAAAAEGLIRDLEALLPALEAASRGALGSASGYGVPLPLDRQRTARLLGLDGLDVGSIHVQNARGRLEAMALFGLHQVSLTLSRFAADLIWCSSEAFAFFGLPEELTTGSSIMPQKRNPDVLEFVRALPSSLLARYSEVSALLAGLVSGYHRDLQRTKGPLMRGLDEVSSAVTVMTRAASGVEVDDEACRAALADEIYATDRVYARVREGMPFRDAYRRVKEEGGGALDPDEVLASRTHTGAPGVDDTPTLGAALDAVRARLAPFADGARTARGLLP